MLTVPGSMPIARMGAYANSKCKMQNAKERRAWLSHPTGFCILNFEF
jgi:hypothetical protein